MATGDKFIDYYSILGVSKDATLNEIKKAYRQKQRETHTDTSGLNVDPTALNAEEHDIFESSKKDKTFKPDITMDPNYQNADQFRAEHPDRAKVYDIKEKVRTYTIPEQDPAYQEFQNEISGGTQPDDAWGRFVEQYPEKAKTYQTQNQYLEGALRNMEIERERRWNELTEKTKLIGKAYDSLNVDELRESYDRQYTAWQAASQPSDSGGASVSYGSSPEPSSAPRVDFGGAPAIPGSGAASAAAGTVAKSVASKAAGKAAASAIGAALGTAVAPIIGTIIGSALAEVGSRFMKFFKRNTGEALAFLASPFLALNGIIAAIAAGIGSALGSVGSTVGISLIAAPLILAFFIYMIQMGGYVVPYSGSATSLDNPPDVDMAACFELRGYWPLPNAENIADASQQIAIETSYVSKLCANGTIYLEYQTAAVRFGGETRGADLIWLSSAGTSNVIAALITLAHESGHVLARRTNLLQYYLASSLLPTELPTAGDKEGLICTYPIPVTDQYFQLATPEAVQLKKDNENFAEMIMLYFSLNGQNICRAAATYCNCFDDIDTDEREIMQDVLPLHWTFAGTYIFN